MVIHQIINDYNLSLGGAQRIAIELHKSVFESKLSSNLFGLSKDTGYQLDGASSLKYKSPYSLLAFVKLWRYFNTEVRTGDIIHVHLFPAIFYVALLHKLKLIPKCTLIMTEHSTFNRRRSKWWGKLLDRFTYSSYSIIIAISKGTAHSLVMSIPHLKNKVRCINNGAHLFFSEFTKRPLTSKTIIVSIGRLHPSKNYFTALSAISTMKNRNFEYWIAGVGDLESDLKDYLENFGLRNKVRLLGYVSDIPNLLRKANIFLIPSKWEGFGLAAIEAMNSGLPCVISDVIGLRELVQKDGEEAFLVDPDNGKLIAERLDQLISNPVLRQKMGSKAFARSQNFGLERMTNEYLTLYKALLNEQSS